MNNRFILAMLATLIQYSAFTDTVNATVVNADPDITTAEISVELDVDC